MNNTRRKQISAIKDKIAELHLDLETLRDEEQAAYDNLPESIQVSAKGDAMEQASGALSEALDYIDQATDQMEDAIK